MRPKIETFERITTEVGFGVNYRDPEKQYLMYTEISERIGNRFLETFGIFDLRYEF